MLKKLMIAGLFGLLLAAGTAVAGGDAANGEALSADCADCHGAAGEGADCPPLAGMDEAVFIEAMKAYASGERTDEMMVMMAEMLSEQDLADLAAYYVKLGAE
jgi:cytochrome c553